MKLRMSKPLERAALLVQKESTRPPPLGLRRSDESVQVGALFFAADEKSMSMTDVFLPSSCLPRKSPAPELHDPRPRPVDGR